MTAGVPSLEPTAPEVAVAPVADRVASSRWSSRSLRVGAGILALMLTVSLGARLLGIGAPDAQHLDDVLRPPSTSHWFGTDSLGRDVFVRTLYATGLDLQVGAITTYVPLVLGLVIGTIAGYAGGWMDTAIMRIVDFLLAFPFMVLVIAVIAIFGPGLAGVYVGLMIKSLPSYVRLTRAEMLVLRERQFILAARSMGFSTPRILSRHALPHVIRPNLVFSISDMLGNILLLATLSYLGLGVQPPQSEWGVIIADGQTYLLNAWWISTLPGLFVVVFGISLSLMGEGLAERLRLRTGGQP